MTTTTPTFEPMRYGVEDLALISLNYLLQLAYETKDAELARKATTSLATITTRLLIARDAPLPKPDVEIDEEDDAEPEPAATPIQPPKPEPVHAPQHESVVEPEPTPESDFVPAPGPVPDPSPDQHPSPSQTGPIDQADQTDLSNRPHQVIEPHQPPTLKCINPTEAQPPPHPRLEDIPISHLVDFVFTTRSRRNRPP
ncbi:MAG: hypothetical protein KF768_12205 [Phycisphaeraceae bacterium]|nr:hypothetical protein [Phycisphaeraceae bacterium]